MEGGLSVGLGVGARVAGDLFLGQPFDIHDVDVGVSVQVGYEGDLPV